MQAEQRLSDRRVLKTRCVFAPNGAQAGAPGRTCDINAAGISILLGGPLKPGLEGRLSFEMFHDGKSNIIHANCKVIHCILSGSEFRIGLNFQQLDLATSALISKYLR
ncbi:PilZ domain-containing protein [Massilia sp. TS11]|uniref:PilZ domain-containing protein n=1 Tax=Massilia sp. TS11 TaxID=2908003 RepID=UPI001EDBF6ED|nr:PilZ domain-containing protein [Massilia sp. TS11]MCG2584249.1 PilZ domain-containing protein [Massilia sp. TS11]